MLENGTFDAVDLVWDIEVDQIAQSQPSKFEISHQLCLIKWNYIFYSF